MKRLIGQKIDYTPRSERTVEAEVPLRPCLVCEKATQGYGVFQAGVVCSRKCNDAYEKTRVSLIDFNPGGSHESSVSPSAGVLRDDGGRNESV